MENVGTRNSGRHNECDFAEVHPSLIAIRFGHWMLLDVVVPGRSRIHSDAGTRFVIPDPA